MGEKGWFGTLTLPRVIELANGTTDSGRPDLYLATPPLPELAALRVDGTHEPLPTRNNMLTSALLSA